MKPREKRNDGTMEFSVGIKDGLIIMSFSRTVNFLAFDKPLAARLADILLEKVRVLNELGENKKAATA